MIIHGTIIEARIRILKAHVEEITNDDVRNHQAFDACAHPQPRRSRTDICMRLLRRWKSMEKPYPATGAAVSKAKVRMKSDPDEQNDCLDQTPMTTNTPQ